MSAVVLASSSPFRQALLRRLQIDFSVNSPDIDETAGHGEAPADLVKRLSIAKAKKVQTGNPEAIIIGSDQISLNAGAILGKPGTAANAIQQLQNASGKTVEFLTGLAVLSPTATQYALVTTAVTFRELSLGEITAYVAADQPLNCAGSFKSEALGISLFSSVNSTDPTALEGLPLIKLCEFLRNINVPLYSQPI